MSETDVNDDLKTRVAWLYYMEGMTQDEVAQEVGLSRARVLRILANARNDGSVQIRVTTKISSCVELERRLEDIWGLDRAIVVPTPSEEANINRIIGIEMARYLNELLRPDMSIGLGWGSTLTAGVPAIEQKTETGLKVISLPGGLTLSPRSIRRSSPGVWQTGCPRNAISWQVRSSRRMPRHARR